MTEIAAKLLTREEAAAFVGVPVRLLESAARFHIAPAFYRFTHKSVYYDRDELLRWKAERQVSPALEEMREREIPTEATRRHTLKPTSP
jgi:hypothetical protein